MAKRNERIDWLLAYDRLMLACGDMPTCEMAARTGIGFAMCQKYKNGGTYGVSTLFRLCNCLGISADWLLGLEKSNKSRRGMGQGRKVMVDGYIFDTLADAADFIGVKPNSIRNYMKKLNRPPKYRGHEIEWDEAKMTRQPPGKREASKPDSIASIVDEAVALGVECGKEGVEPPPGKVGRLRERALLMAGYERGNARKGVGIES